jgi:hypothetical protein
MSANKGASGWAKANASAISSKRLDPTAVGQAFNLSSARNAITQKINGATATVTVSGSTWKVGSAVGEARGNVALTATNTALKFSSTPNFFSEKDIIDLLPKLGFSMLIYAKTGWRTELVMYGHYQVDPAVATDFVPVAPVSVDDKTILGNPGHTKMTIGNSGMLNTAIMTNVDITTRTSAQVKNFAAGGAQEMNAGMVKVYQGYAKAMTFTVGNVTVPYTFGVQFGGLTQGSATISTDNVVAKTWLASFNSSTTNRKVSLAKGSELWQSGLNSAVTTAITKAGLTETLNSALNKALSYDQLANVISGRTDAEMTKDIDEMVVSVVDGLHRSISGTTVKTNGVPGYGSGYSVFKMDNIKGNTTFGYGGQKAQAMYPNLKTDIASELIDMIKSRVKSATWKSAVTKSVAATSTTTIKRTFTPGNITQLSLTNVTNVTATTLPTVLPTRSAPTATAVGKNDDEESSFFGRIIEMIQNMFSDFFGWFNIFD